MPMFRFKEEKQIVTNDSNHLWEYFDSMARQRTQIFYFYVAISMVFWAGLGATESRMFHGEDKTPDNTVEIFVLSFFVLITWIFYTIEIRCKEIVYYAEDCIRKYSKNDVDSKIFSTDEPNPQGCCIFKKSLGTAYKNFFTLSVLGALGAFFYFSCEHIDCNCGSNLENCKFGFKLASVFFIASFVLFFYSTFKNLLCEIITCLMYLLTAILFLLIILPVIVTFA